MDKFKIEPRQEFWKHKHYKTVEKGKDWQILRPAEVPPLEDMINKVLKHKKHKWE